MLNRFERFSSSIFEIYRHWHKIASDEMEKYGLKGTHCIYLITMLQHPEGITAASLCELCGRDKADVSRMMSIMEKKGLVQKDNAQPSLYRCLLKLTQEGIAAAEQVCHRALVAVENAGKGLDELKRVIFYESLELICGNLRQLSQDGLPEENKPESNLI
jgi:DNA-binding MarR family transcriptional regulator